MPETSQFDSGRSVIRFAAFGDSGSGSPAQRAIADQLLLQHDLKPYGQVILLGDNLYPNGNAPRYGEDRFTSLYRPLLERDVQFRPTLGNHDISGPLGVGFPTFGMSNQKGHISFFGMPGAYYDFRLENVHFFIINTNRFRKKQRHWLAEQLSKTDAAWKIVCGHHPVFSSGFHGSTPYLKKSLKPLLERHGVQFYLAGHEHDYERFDPINGVTYIVSGGGGADLRKFRHPLPDSRVRLSQYHFLFFECIGEALQYSVINEKGVIIDSEAFWAYASEGGLLSKAWQPERIASHRL